MKVTIELPEGFSQKLHILVFSTKSCPTKLFILKIDAFSFLPQDFASKEHFEG